MNITIDPTIPGALGSFGFDDEGSPAVKRDAVRDGRWVGVLAGRDSAAVAGLDYGGSVRADGWARLPMVRMTNVGLEPGPHTLDEIIAATDDGVLMDINRSWSIDDKRLNFQFGCEIGWEIKKGRRGRMLRNPTYTGIGPLFWRSMDMLSCETVPWGTPELRQGPTRPDRAHRPPGRAGPVPQRPGGGARRDRPASESHGGLTELELAGQVVELVRRLGRAGRAGRGGGDRADLALTRFANSVIHQNVSESTVGVRLRVHVDGRTAAGGGSVVTADGLRALVERTLAAARLCPPDPGWPGLTPPCRTPDAPPVDEATAHAEPDRAGRPGPRVRGRRRGPQHGRLLPHRAPLVGVRQLGRALGVRALGRGGDGRHRPGRRARTGWPGAAPTGSPTSTAPTLGAQAAAKAQAAADPVELPPGRYEVVLEPAAVADLLQNLSWYGFNGKRYAERQSFAEPGAAQFDPAVTLVDDPLGGVRAAVRRGGHRPSGR